MTRPIDQVPWHEERDQVVAKLQQLREAFVPRDEFKAVINRAIALLLPAHEDMHGPLAMAIRVVDGRVRMEWGRPLEYLSFGPNQAQMVAAALVANAQLHQGGDSGEASKAPDEETAARDQRNEALRTIDERTLERRARFQAIEGRRTEEEKEPGRPDAVQPAGDSPPAEGARGGGALGGDPDAAAGGAGPDQFAPGDVSPR